MTRTAREINLTEGPICRQLTRFFLPIVFGSVFQQLYNTVDALVVGNYAGTQALAAVGGTTAAVISLLLGFFIGLSSGATVILSQACGAGDARQTHDTVHTAAALALLFGGLLTALGLAFCPMLLERMRTPADVLAPAVTYIRIYFLGMIPQLIYNIGAALLRAVGDSKRPLGYLAAASVLNIALDLLFVAKLGMGVAGAAWATVLSQALSAVLIVRALMRSEASYRLRPREICLNREILGRVFRIGLPAGIQSTMYSLSNVIIQVALNDQGSTVLAAWTAYSKQDFLYWMVINALGVAATTFAGQNYGAGKMQRLKRGVRICLGLSAGATLLIGGVLFVFARPLYAFFSKDPAVIDCGVAMSRLLVPSYFLYLCIEIYSGALRGCGDTLLPTIITLVGICLLRAVWLLLLGPAQPTLSFVLLCYPVTWAITSVLFVIYWRRFQKERLSR